MTLRLHAHDPGPALEAAFRRIESESMAGLPLLNGALRVQAVDVARWQGQWLGALVTPWFINLVLVPADAASWVSVPEGQRRFLRFCAGDFAFLGGCEPEIGEFQSCSLISPPADFVDQGVALATAREALRLLHVEPRAVARGGCGTPAPARAPIGGPAIAPGGEPASARGAASETKLPRRTFFLGRAA